MFCYCVVLCALDSLACADRIGNANKFGMISCPLCRTRTHRSDIIQEDVAFTTGKVQSVTAPAAVQIEAAAGSAATAVNTPAPSIVSVAGAPGGPSDDAAGIVFGAPLTVSQVAALQLSLQQTVKTFLAAEYAKRQEEKKKTESDKKAKPKVDENGYESEREDAEEEDIRELYHSCLLPLELCFSLLSHSSITVPTNLISSDSKSAQSGGGDNQNQLTQLLLIPRVITDMTFAVEVDPHNLVAGDSKVAEALERAKTKAKAGTKWDFLGTAGSSGAASSWDAYRTASQRPVLSVRVKLSDSSTIEINRKHSQYGYIHYLKPKSGSAQSQSQSAASNGPHSIVADTTSDSKLKAEIAELQKLTESKQQAEERVISSRTFRVELEKIFSRPPFNRAAKAADPLLRRNHAPNSADFDYSTMTTLNPRLIEQQRLQILHQTESEAVAEAAARSQQAAAQVDPPQSNR